jgi:hypothetical protein
MNNEFKKSKSNNETRYTLESMTAGATGSGSIATSVGSVGKVQKRGNILAQEAGKDKVPATTPRNFVAKNAKTSGAGAHKDKKKEQKQGAEKHKKPYMESLRTKIDQLKLKLAEQGVAEGSEDLASLRAKANEISNRIDAIVKGGGRVGLDDPLSRQLKAIRSKIQQAKKQGVAEGSGANKTYLAMAYLKAVVMAPMGTPEKRRILNWQQILSNQFDIEMDPATLAQMLPQFDSQLKSGQLDKLQNRMASRGELEIGESEQGAAEGFPKDPNAPKLVRDRKTGKQYDPNKEFAKKMNSPEVMAQMKRMAQKEGVEDRTSYQVAKILSDRGIKYDPAQENELINAIGMVLVKELNMTPKEARNLISYDEDFVADTMGELRSMEQSVSEVDVYMESLAHSLQQVLSEKAVSKKQQKFMGMVHAAQKGEKPASKEVAKVAKDMGKKDAEDFASTKHKGLPEKKKSKK